MEDKKIYFDNNDTTPMVEPVFNAMKPYFMENFGNPASLHEYGLEAEEAVGKAREDIANLINATPEELIFTGGATEANNLALFGLARMAPEKKRHIITSKVEHHAILNTVKRLGKEGFKVTFLEVDREGFVDPDDLKKAITPETFLVTVVHGNHVVGTVQDLNALGQICRDSGVLFHTDAAQSFTKVPLNVKDTPIDLISLNSHKIHGPKGVGALYMRKGVKIGRLMEGGPQENNRRPGTENVPGIMGFAEAARIGIAQQEENNQHICKIRDRLLDRLLEIPHTHINGPQGDKRLSTNANITFLYIEGEAILMHLSMRGVFVSSGSACSSIALQPSNVLTAIGLKHEEAHGSIRFSFSKLNTEEEVDIAVGHMHAVVDQLRSMSAFIPEEHSEIEGKGTTFYKKKKDEF
ncbi:cysteine desulfurase NifS [candidate division LCP-89 bacterium B3_LCP]|uniref:cysteine desulfurase n=1 Tax=candidate division LCP-89 bacterium B3_LCP TaxID=2012998 RepID=A0A532UVS9_UNCL8|nr:MAG: cysteine desulfurase NifS [candidate division LCP-89 bacterium B3_LCP]